MTDAHTRTLAAGSDMLAPGTVLAGRYRIVEIGGVGGMGIVYRAHDEQLGVDVALKLLHPARSGDAASAERFQREVLLARRVSHPNVVRLHDIGEDAGVRFLTMDYVQARTLREHLADGPMDTASALAVARAIAEALGAAHAVDVIHRDLKPANILVDDAHRAWLTDFGIARALGDPGVTVAGELVGTLDYLAPEQVRGEPVTPATDVYALGLMLWEALTGRVPLCGDTREETLARRATASGAVRLPDADGVPKRVRRIVERCVAASPADRYANGDALAADLAAGARGVHVTRRARVAAAAVIALVAVAAAWQAFPPVADPVSSAVAVEQRRVAVLPLVNATGDPSLDWVRRALSEQISASFGANPALQPVDSVRVFRSVDDLRVDVASLDERAVRELAGLFNADALVRGQLLGAGDGLRLELRVHTRTGERRVHADVDRSAILSAADGLTRSVAAALDAPPPPAGERVRISESADALTAYDEGTGRLARGDRSGGIEALERAVDADPGFGVAWLRLAAAYRDAGHYDKAIDAAARAVEFAGVRDGRHGLAARALHASLSGDQALALALVGRLGELNPQDADAATTHGEWLGDAGRYDEAMDRLKAAVDVEPQHPRAWFLLGKFAILAGDARAAADEWLVRALVVQNRFGTDEGRAEVLNALGIANEHLGSLDVASAHYREAARLRAAAGDRRGEAGSLANLARLMLVSGDLARARETLARALGLREAIGDLPGVADLRNEFGVLEEEAGRYAAALEHYREALRLRTEVGDTRGVAESYGNLAFAYFVHGELDHAEAFAARALAAHEASGSAEGRMATQLTRAQLMTARGDWNAARTAMLDALTLARSGENPFAEAAAEGAIGALSRLQGRAAAAFDAYGRALDIVGSLGDSRGVAEFRLQRAGLWLELGVLDDARADVAAAAEALGRDGSIAQRATLAALEGAVAAAEGDDDTARARFDTAAALAAETGSPGVVLAVDIARARWLDTDPQRAMALAADAARLGHRVLRLEALTRAAELHALSGRTDAAFAAVRDAQRPPVAIESWGGNWRLHATRAAVDRANGGDGAEAAARALELLDGQWAGLPDSIRERRGERHHALAIQHRR